jgi:hypothetical protein
MLIPPYQYGVYFDLSPRRVKSLCGKTAAVSELPGSMLSPKA